MFIGASNKECAVHYRCAVQKLKKIAWVGGVNDKNTEIVKGVYKKHGKESDAYFQWWQGRRLAAWVTQNKHCAITLIGHSYGGNTAASVVAKGYCVAHLITVDPVGMRRPNFKKVATHCGMWTNYNSVGSGACWANTVAALGRAYNSAPKHYADFHQNVKLNHVDICLVHCKP